jgi:hypothetical protein
MYDGRCMMEEGRCKMYDVRRKTLKGSNNIG